MMAVAFSGFATSALEVLVVKVSSLLIDTLKSTLEIDDNLGKIGRTLVQIQSILSDLESCRIYDKSVIVWCRHLTEVMYDVDDLLNKIATEKGDIWLQPTDLKKNPATASEIMRLRKKLDALLDEMSNIHSRALIKKSLVVTKERALTTSLVDEASILSRTNDKCKIIQMLISDEKMLISNEKPDALGKNLDVVSIVGTLGIGKTTLAKHVYNDDVIVRSFSKRIWISMPEFFDISVITKMILDNFLGECNNITDLNFLQERLRLKLCEVKFLIVMDGSWHSKQIDWDNLYLPLRYGRKGSKILVTSQSRIVSTVMHASCMHNLEKLSDSDCLSLFCKEAFRVRPENEILLKLANDVIKTWHGLPLVAKSLGMILSFSSDEVEWEEVLSRELGDLPDDNNSMFEAIRFASYHISPRLREGLAFCGLFPSSHVFKKDILIQMWMAEGCIKSNGKRRLEDIGAAYIEELLGLSVFQFVDLHDDSRFSLPCIMHMLARYMSFDDCLKLVNGDKMKYHSCISKYARHACVVESEFDLGFIDKFKKLRTFLSPGKAGIPKNFNCKKFFENAKLLRLLDFSYGKIDDVPNSIRCLKNLRYLDLFHVDIEFLPHSILTLSNLETLRLKGCKKLRELPEDFARLINLRYLGLDSDALLTCMPLDIDRMPHLHTLTAFFVGETIGSEIQVVKNMNDLRGTLRILKLENVTSAEMAVDALVGKQHLEKLILRWSTSTVVKAEDSEAVLACLQPHSNLRQLQIFGYNGVSFPDWIGEPSLSNLHTVVLSDCGSCVSLPLIGNLPCLKVLSIISFNGVVLIDANVTNGFPLLDILTISRMANLEKWNGPLGGHCSRLRVLKISSCPKLASLPELPLFGNLQDLQVIECPGLESLPRDGVPVSLRNIEIILSPQLQENCEEGGPDREKISHLNITLGNPVESYKSFLEVNKFSSANPDEMPSMVH